MENRFKDSAIKTIEYPSEYPSRIMARAFSSAHPGLLQALSQATALECRYEELTRDIKAGGRGVMDKAMELTTVEDQLFGRYLTLTGNNEEKSQQMILHTSLLARDRTKSAGKQV